MSGISVCFGISAWICFVFDANDAENPQPGTPPPNEFLTLSSSSSVE
jgi:hypothetical protein